MSRSSRTGIFVALVAAIALLPSANRMARAADQSPRKPNILVIVADDLGYGEIGCYGGKEIPTPHIDSLAKNGVRCTNGYVSCPVCSPTRAGLITGRYQQRFGHEFNPGAAETAQQNFGLPLIETTFADRLKAEGYATGLVGKWHLGHREGYQPLKRGFEEFFGFLGGAHTYQQIPAAKKKVQQKNLVLNGTEQIEEPEYLTEAFSREATAYIDRHAKHPFFLYLTFNAVHSPLQAPQKYLERFSRIEDQKRRIFCAMLSALDDAVGNVLSKLRENNLEEDTLIFFISDNGGPTRQTTSGNGPLNGFKAQVLEGGIRVPFLVQWKGRLQPGKTYNHPVISLDILPTALAASGKPNHKARLDGVNLLPHLSESVATPPHAALYWRFGEQFAIRKGNWKLVKTPMMGEPRLFDLAEDIGEKNDLSATKPEVLKDLQTAYASWNSQLTEPLWRPQR